ncbi:MAG: hypothetical protein KBT13_02325 [Bacteroidales bacterium]|uniref:hypothetical protein n=1 Tax=Sodaliphilus sp. TaxID=2815818 RepID=UPI001B50F8CC|nr:hypothetical protein [Candidatus Sodaliphilus limicaballi]
MKKLSLLLLGLVMSVSALAQKEYVNVVANDVFASFQDIYLSGAIPAGMKSFYDGYYDRKTVGEIINTLADNGFTVEQVSSSEAVKSSTASYTREVVLMSKPKGTPIGAIQTVGSDTEPTEVARYNLQGLPVDKDEPGVQIVIFSNYTSRVIVNQ